MKPEHTILFNAEDGIADTTKPRLTVMQADDSKIHAFNGALVLDDRGKREFEFYIQDIKPKLVIIDPLSAHLGPKINSYVANEVRPFMTHLAELAATYKCAIIIVRHLTKGGTGNALFRGSGSVDFSAAARSELLVGCDPDDDSKRAMVHLKCNVAALGDALGYVVDEGRFVWTGKTDLTAERILAPMFSEQDGGSAIEKAKDFLVLALTPGNREAESLFAEARTLGISKTTLKRAKKALNVKSYHRGSNGKRGVDQWLWSLPLQGGQPTHMGPLTPLNGGLEELGG